MPPELKLLVAALDRCRDAMDALLPRLQAQRRLLFAERSDSAQVAFDALAAEGAIVRAELDAAMAALSEATGIGAEDLESAAQPVGDPLPKISRASVVEEAPPPSAWIEDYLPQAIDLIERHAPKGWLDLESADRFRLSDTRDGRSVSIVKGVRLESERPGGHRLRQAVALAKDYLANDVRYDHFGGALAVTQLAQLGARAEALAQVRGWRERLKALFTLEATDAVMMELLVAAGCAAKGRDMALVTPTAQKSPDLRCDDPFGMVVECKRSAALSDYEVTEEARIRDLFAQLQARSADRGLFGLFELELTIETSNLDVEEVIKKCLLQHRAAHPERARLSLGIDRL